MTKYERCPCTSRALYHKCCQPYHQGTLPDNALALMRSRYSAYALGLIDYIVITTHPEHADCSLDAEQWKRELHHFCQETRFDGLKVLDFTAGDEVSYVTFTAYVRQFNRDVSFTEKSLFIKENGKWLYKSGEVTPA